MWKPLAEDKLARMIDEAQLFMSPDCRRFWDNIKITPQKWTHSPWGDEGGGFWVVAVIGNTCIYYNDIEEGFNFSPYKRSARSMNIVAISRVYCRRLTTFINESSPIANTTPNKSLYRSHGKRLSHQA